MLAPQIYDLNLASGLKKLFAKHEMLWRGVGKPFRPDLVPSARSIWVRTSTVPAQQMQILAATCVCWFFVVMALSLSGYLHSSMKSELGLKDLLCTLMCRSLMSTSQSTALVSIKADISVMVASHEPVHDCYKFVCLVPWPLLLGWCIPEPALPGRSPVLTRCYSPRAPTGWHSVEEYYHGSSSCRRIPDITIPVLCLQVGKLVYMCCIYRSWTNQKIP